MNDYVHIEAADLRRPNARFTTERQGYQVLTPFGKLGYSPGIDELPRSVAIFTVGAIMIADFYFIFRWASKRLDVNPKAFDGE